MPIPDMPIPDMPIRFFVPDGTRVVVLMEGTTIYGGDRTTFQVADLYALPATSEPLDPYYRRRLHRAVQSVSPERLATLYWEARRRGAGDNLPFLPNYFVALSSSPTHARELASRLRAAPGVRSVYVAPNLGRLPSLGGAEAESVPDLSANEPQLSAAPDGVGARLVWDLPGGLGQGVAFIDIEDSWNVVDNAVTHDDLPLGISLIWGTPDSSIELKTHGMAAVGVVMAVHDSPSGGDGIAPAVSPAGVAATDGVTSYSGSHVPGIDPDDELSAHLKEAWNALTAAINFLYDTFIVPNPTEPAPAVILLEQQAAVVAAGGTVLGTTGSSHSSGPVETDALIAALIRVATSFGIAVVEPTGNGPLNLANVRNSDGDSLVDPLLSGRSRCGAILVSGTDQDGKRDHACNYGANVALHAQAEPAVNTLGYDPDDPAKSVYTMFNGTSLASATVAGAVAVARAMALQVAGGPRNVADLVDLLVKTGSPSADGDSRPIGAMPDLAAVAVELGLAPRVYLRDHDADGGQSHSGAIGDSLDLFVFKIPMNPVNSGRYEQGGSMVPKAPSASARHDATAYVYARVTNLSAASQNVSVTVHYVPDGKEGSFADWRSLGTLTRAGLTASSGPWLLPGSLEWTPDAAVTETRATLVAVLETDDFKAPLRDSVVDQASFEAWIRKHPSVTVRKVDILPAL